MAETFIRLLLVEDNAGDARLFQEMLNERKPSTFAMTAVGRMTDAVDHLAANVVDIILLDLGLPDAQGLEAVRRAHAAAPRIPLVVLTPIAWIIEHQNDAAPAEMADLRLGASLLRVTLAFDELVRTGVSKSEASNRLLSQFQQCDPRIFQALAALDGEGSLPAVRTCDITELLPFDTIIEEELRTKTGLLLVAKGQQVTPTLILKLRNFLDRGAIGSKVAISKTATEAKAATV